ncbi:MAG: PilT/PilU family type 4a pilus ATPase [Deltaproteobacteria bacterium]|nr:PilT/PilU family type 4a pilus ATPase [Deltaproteobacteria bacterium]MBN2670860.1 PilT/PilU family type 4a pilus ATPase [Deltaproteobacteria bacterium]
MKRAEGSTLSDSKNSSKPQTEKLFPNASILSLDEPSETFHLAEHVTPLELDEPSETFPLPPDSSTLRMHGPPPVPSSAQKRVSTSPPPMTRVDSATRKSMPPPPILKQAGSVQKHKSMPPPPMTRVDSATRKSMPPPPPHQKKSGDATGTTPYYGLKVTGGLLGQILVDNGFITDDQRDYCLKLQSQSGNFFRIGELAVKQEFISEENLALCLKAQKTYVQGIKKEQSRMIRLPEEVAKAQLASDGQGAAMFKKWLSSALKHGASDLHVMTGQPLVLRHMGKLVRSKQSQISAERATEVLESVLSDADKEQLKQNSSILKCIELKGVGRARANVFRHMGGLNGTFRLIPKNPPSLVSLNLPSQLAKFTTYAQGLVLVTGPIGCGKTNTMAALVDIVNRERRNHIITIERPVEFIHQNARSIVTQREVGIHTKGYASALRAALRQDPDVIVVGEMNDVETARLAISAAETGHLVFATLHTDNAVRTINRVLDIFPPDEQNQIRSMLSESLRGVVCQRLVARHNEPGLIPVMELLFTTPAIRNLIRESKVYQLPNAIRMSKELGNRTFSDYAAEMVSRGDISEATYEQFCMEET